MKKILLLSLLCWCGLLYGQRKMSEKVVLNENWFFSEAGTDEWLTAEVPGTVHQDLLRHRLLPDPFYGLNEEKIQWVEKKDWEYKTTFVVTAGQLEREGACLDFEGLDTYADVYLNGALLLKTDNMFVGYSVPVKSVLKEGENRLRIYFHSPIRQTMPQWASNGFDYPADNDHSEQRLSVFTRKAPYSYGWDWGIRMVTSGVWRPVTLCFYDLASIGDFHVRQLSLTDKMADISNELTINSIASRPEKVEVSVSCSVKGKPESTIRQEVLLQPGENKIILPLGISEPQRWMPNGWGEPVLYDFIARVSSDGRMVAEKKQRIGLRTLRVINEKDAGGESFYFEVNGVPMFAKGANYIPADALLPAMTDDRYNVLFRDIKEANMNMIRVWGGGTYEDDRFYNLADENGILIWQDFMFACTVYPHDPAFLKRVEEEAVYNIKRLRNHACLAMWCGNNEILEGLKYWGWKNKYSPVVYEDMWKGYDCLFRELLPEKIKELDEGRFYIHGSPYFANWGRPESWKTGDSHNWGVWYGRKPFESLDTEIPRFMSEFGFQAFPEMKTIATFASSEDYTLESEVMNAHQKSSIGNDLIRTYMEREYILPEKFEDFVYVGLVMQGKGIRQGLEAHRRNRPYCMGTLYWQLNDSWPVVSWSGIDYYGNWKALHYQARRAFAPLTVDVVPVKDSLQFWLLSDKLQDEKHLTLEMQLIDFNGKLLKRKIIKTAVDANTSVCVWRTPLSGWGTSEQQKSAFLLLTLKDKAGQKVTGEPYFFNSPKNLNLPETEINYRLKTMNGRCEVTLNSKKLAKDVFIEIPLQGARFSDNFFDLLPGESRKIVITSPLLKKGDPVNLKINQIRNTYK